MTYTELKQSADDKITNFPVFFAFSNQQLEEGCKKLGVIDMKSELYSLGGGGFVRKTDSKAFNKLFESIENEKAEWLKDPDNLQNAFEYELANHEYCITSDVEPTLDALGMNAGSLTEEQKEILVKAREIYLANCDY